jgi:hypothetical protein
MSLWHIMVRAVAAAMFLLFPVHRGPESAGTHASGAHAATGREAFRPSTHGFQFRNSFQGSPLPPALRGWGIEGSVQLPEEFGLCGGMSLAAADYYLNDLPLPQDRSPPPPGSPLYEALYARQVDSLGMLGIAATKFVLWMAMPDESAQGVCIRAATATELPRLLARLDDGQLVPLGMVYRATSGPDRGMLWENHQVLVYGYEAGPSAIALRVYDPNYPRHDNAVIRVRPAAGHGGAGEPAAKDAWKGWKRVVCELDIGTRRAPRPVRGIFPMAYAPKRPAL